MKTNEKEKLKADVRAAIDLQDGKQFTIKAISEEHKFTQSRIQNFIVSLAKKGYLESKQIGISDASMYRKIKNWDEEESQIRQDKRFPVYQIVKKTLDQLKNKYAGVDEIHGACEDYQNIRKEQVEQVLYRLYSQGFIEKIGYGAEKKYKKSFKEFNAMLSYKEDVMYNNEENKNEETSGNYTYEQIGMAISSMLNSFKKENEDLKQKVKKIEFELKTKDGHIAELLIKIKDIKNKMIELEDLNIEKDRWINQIKTRQMIKNSRSEIACGDVARFLIGKEQ